MTSSAVRTAPRVASEIPGRPLRTRLTVASLTPACLATSARLRATLQFYDNSCKRLVALRQELTGQPPRGERKRERAKDGQVERGDRDVPVEGAERRLPQELNALVERQDLDHRPRPARVDGERIEGRREQEHRQHHELDQLKIREVAKVG